jgi:hypothetical protein
MRVALVAALSALVLPSASVGSAWAADRPPFPPTRDVSVTYHVNAKAAGAPETATLAFSAELQKLHAEGGPGAMIIDLPQQSVVVMIAAAHIAMRMPAGRAIDRILDLGTHGEAQRVGSDRVAGYRCTIWRFTGRDGSGTACVTDDGVPLRGEGSDGRGSGAFEALAVTYGAQPASLFEVPPGYKRMELPAGLGRSSRPAP